MVTVVSAWTRTMALPAGYVVPPPAAQSLAVPVANTGLGGNWLFAVCAWRSPPGILTTVAVGDDAHNISPGANVWEPLGAPNGTSLLTGNVTVSIWYCRNALPAQNVYVAPNGLVTALSVVVAEVAGLSPWYTTAAISTGYGSAVSSLTVPAAVPSGQALLFAAAGTDGGLASGPGGGWTRLGRPPAAGAYLNEAAYGAADWTGAYAAWTSLGGPPLTVTRAYYAPSSFGVPLRTDVAQMIAGGMKVCIDLKPAYNPVSGTDLANMTLFLQALQAAGAECDISLWHEPFFSGLSAAQYQAMIAFYGPAVRQFYPLAVCLSGNDTDPVNGYYPPASQYDKITVDAYAASSIAQVTNAETQADANGKPFGIWEFNGATDAVSGESPVAVTAFFAFIESLMEARAAAGKPCADVILFSSGAPNWLGTGLTQTAGFEGGPGNWVNAGNATITQTTAQAHSGTGSLQITANSSGNALASHCATTLGGLTAHAMPVTAGQTVAASAWFRAAVTPRNCQVPIAIFNSAGTLLSTTFGTAVADAAGGWTQVSNSVTAPAGAAFAVAETEIGSAAASEVHYADDVDLAIIPGTDLSTAIQFSWDYRIGLLSSMQVGYAEAFPLTLAAAWQVTSGAATATWGVSAPADIAGIIGGVLVTAAAPVAPSQTWPYIQFLAGFGAGAATPWDQIAFTDITARLQSFSGGRGKQYELDTIQSGTPNMLLSNNDAALTPGNSASQYFPFVQPYTPERFLATWPPPPAQNARTYSVWRGFAERWPQSLTSTRYQVSNSTGTDVYALMSTLMLTLPRAEILAADPYGYWPLSDLPGAPAAANLARGNSQFLQVVESKYGAGGAAAAFGVSVSYLAGDPGCTGWQQSSVPAADIQGWCLYYQDTGLPPINGGVTVEGWFAFNTAQPTGVNLTLIAVRNPQGGVLTVRLNSSGQLVLDVKDRITGAITSTTITTANLLTGIPCHVMVEFTQSAWTIYVDGGAVASVSGACNLAASGYWLTFGGVADRAGGASTFANVIIAHLAVYGYLLPQSAAVAHFYSAVAAMTGEDTSGPRIDRLLGDGGCAFPRVLPAGPDLYAGALDIGGQAVNQNAVNVAESDSSWLMVDSPGYLFLQARRGGYNLPVLWTFGELQASPLNVNYQFNGTITPWTAGNGTTLSFSATWSYGLGEGSLLIGPDGVTAGPYATAELDAVTPGISYTAAAWVQAPNGWTGVHVAIDWYSALSVLLSSTAQVSTGLAAGVPAELTVTGRAPATAAFAAISVHMDGTPPSSTGLYTGYAALTGPNEYAYLPDIATDCDPSILYNDITLSQLSSPAVSSTTLTAPASSSAVTLTVGSAAGMTIGGVLLLAPSTATAELVTITAISGTTIGITATTFAHSATAPVTVINAQATGVTITASTPASITAYGDQTLQQTSYLADPAAITDQAQWITRVLGTPSPGSSR